MERVYATAFARHGLVVRDSDLLGALHATWKEVAARHAAGEERWGGEAGEAGFWHRFVETVFEKLGGGPLPQTLLGELVVHFQAESHWRVFDDVPHVLGELRRRGYKLLVVSNWDSSLPLLLERLKVAPLVDAILASALIGVSKPSPEIFLEALVRADVSAAEALHVGDSPDDDCGGALSAGLSAILLDRAGTKETPYRTIRSLSALLDVLPGIPESSE